MAKNLIIVESPAKTRTLKKFLGSDYVIEASLGHIRDLEKKNLGLGENYEPRYRIIPAKQDTVDKLRKAAKKAEVVYLAPDPDREGEAIAWHIAEVLQKDPLKVRRVTFNEITKTAVLQALKHPGEIDTRRVDAQQARRVLDRLMGFKLSPLLWDKVKQGLSAGRVQSVALKMICERQAEIDCFSPVEYWNLGADLEASELPIVTVRLHQTDGKKAKVTNGEQAGEIVDALNTGKFVVKKIEQKESKQHPGAPFITSRLQQEAARKFGFSVKRTMIVAQGLYEGKEIGDRGPTGLITYMRTDSTRVAEEALAGIRELISTTYGAESLPKEPNRFRTKKSAQDAHEAIRPTTFDLPPEALESYLNKDELKLYRLIWSRFVASQMLPAIFDVTQADIENGRYVLRAQGKILRRPGFLSVYRETTSADQDTSAEKDDLLPPLSEGETLKLVKVNSEQKFTKPPAQFSEASLVKALEDNGIGRPSTYASILSTLSDRSYAEKVNRRFRPSALGKVVNTLLQDGFSDIINEGYTAKLEEVLDQIEEGKLDWRKELARFDEKFEKDLAVAEIEMPNVKKDGIPTDEICPECKSPLVMRFGRFGGFLGCTGYPTCNFTRNIEEPDDGDDAASQEEQAPCEKCGLPMVKKRSRYGVFYGCSGYPDCKNIRRTGPPAEEPQTTGVPCPDCGKGEIHQKRSRRGKIFFSCNRYPDCKFALWNKPVAEPCPQCNAPFLLEKTTKKKGLHKICNNKECDFEESMEEATG